jgi:hypothetical protein
MTEGLAEAFPQAGQVPLELTTAVVDALEWDDPEAEWQSGRQIFANAHINLKEE